MDQTPEKPPRRKRGRPKSQFNDGPAETLQSVERALVVLKEVARLERTTLSDLSLSLSIPTATAHRVLKTLESQDFAAFDEETQDWMVGIEAYRTGAAFLNQSNLTQVGYRAMRGLMRMTGETANLAVHDKFEVVFIGQVETHNPIRAFFPPGSRSSMHASGAGKAILSAFAVEQVRKLLETAHPERFTEYTFADPAALIDELARTRARGWSFDREERYLGMSCIGSAIFDRNATPIAAVSISGPSTRFADDKVSEFGEAVALAAADITRQTGGRVPQD
jgi:IclR family acetate operon transcriptional repressor